MVGVPEELLILLLLRFQVQQEFFDLRRHGKRAAAGSVLGLVLGNHCGDLGNRAANADGLRFKVHTVPTEAQRKSISKELDEATGLTTALADLLIDRVRVYPDNRIEIEYKVQDLFE